MTRLRGTWARLHEPTMTNRQVTWMVALFYAVMPMIAGLLVVGAKTGIAVPAAGASCYLAGWLIGRWDRDEADDD